MLHLILDVLFHTLLLPDLLLLLHVEEDSCRHADGDGILRLGLEGKSSKDVSFTSSFIFTNTAALYECIIQSGSVSFLTVVPHYIADLVPVHSRKECFNDAFVPTVAELSELR